ncbi:MAG: 50S ribosomal protein L30 [Rickettsiales bacterium]|nr:50S ribosomal protein L30 [Rickettsiales bacterium]
MTATKKIKIKQIGSYIGRHYKQEQILRGLGLKKLYQERELLDTPEVRGMIRKLPHLVQIIEG